MSSVKVKFLGSGDAFGSGGRLQSCIIVKARECQFLMDCGASSMIALRRHDIDPNDIELILVTNLHGDHFGGIPYFIVDAQINRKRTAPLTIAGPPGIADKFKNVIEATFPGTAEMKMKFQLEIAELPEGTPWHYENLIVTPFPVVHAEGDPHQALKIVCDDKVIAYSGDTEWTDCLIPLADVSDLLIIEAYFFDKKVKYHLDYQTLLSKSGMLHSKKIVVTHMTEDMLARVDDIEFSYAEDGKTFEIPE